MDHVKVVAVQDVSLQIEKQDFAVIVGPSGSGKSTLMHILGALDRPTSGEVLIDGHKLSLLDEDELAELRRLKIGFVFQAFHLIPTLTALENVSIPAEPLHLPKEEVRAKAEELLADIGLADRMQHKPSELSGGQRQRVSIARALMNDPEIIFADEPTGNLDSVTGEKVLEVMRHLNKEHKKTFVIVTHDPSLFHFSTKTFHIKDGLLERQRK